jgi:beta-xylosidase
MSGSFQLVHGEDVVSLDTDGNEILSQSGDVRKFGDTYYWYGDRVINQVFSGIACYSSKDLAHWKFESVVHSTPPGNPADPTDAVGVRPSVVYNSTTQTYVMIFERALHFATSATPCGQFVDQGFAMIPNDRGGGDRGVFQDDDGKVYVVYATWPYPDQYNTDIGIVRLTPDYLHVDQVVAPTTGMHCEAPYIVKRNGLYYMFASQCYDWYSSSTSYATATNLAGPWSAPKTVTTIPSDGQSFNSQHDFTVTVTGAKGTVYMYFGDRWSEFTGQGIGKNVRLPLTFNGNEPVLNGLNSWYINVTTGEWSPTPIP